MFNPDRWVKPKPSEAELEAARVAGLREDSRKAEAPKPQEEKPVKLEQEQEFDLAHFEEVETPKSAAGAEPSKKPFMPTPSWKKEQEVEYDPRQLGERN